MKTIINIYRCNDHGLWADVWSCERDDKCPVCGKEHEPTASFEAQDVLDMDRQLAR